MRHIATLLSLFGVVFSGTDGFATNLVTNGDFEAGNSGFTSDYSFVPGPNSGAAQYTVDTNPNAWNGAFPAIGDNTSGSGQMLIVNSSTDTSDNVWEQELSVVSGLPVAIEFYATSLFSSAPSNIVVEADGQAVDSFSLSGTTVGVWNFFSTSFVPTTSGTVEVALRDSVGAFGGSDFAIDDIAATQVPEPSAIALAYLIASVCGTRRRRLS